MILYKLGGSVTNVKLLVVSAPTKEAYHQYPSHQWSGVNPWNKQSNPDGQVLSVWIKSMSSETIRQTDVIPDHPLVTELHVVSGE